MIEFGVNDGFLYLPLKSSDFLSHYSYQRLKKNISDQNQNFKKKRDRKPDILKSMRNQRKVCVLIMKPPPKFIIVFTLIPHILILPFVNKLYAIGYQLTLKGSLVGGKWNFDWKIDD